jgi:hypothetical protein
LGVTAILLGLLLAFGPVALLIGGVVVALMGVLWELNDFLSQHRKEVK